MSGELSVGIVGLDSPYWPPAFADVISQRSDATLAGFTTVGTNSKDVESNLGMSIADFEATYGIPRVSGVDDMSAVADAVFVCTRNTLMPGAIVDALEHDLHVFAAKPVAVTRNDVRAIERTAAESGGVFAAGQSGRNHPAMRAVRRLVRDGRIGDVHALRVMHQHWRYAEWAGGTWYEDSTEGTACHWLGWYPIDVAVSILGPAVELKADGRQLANDFEAQPDHLNAIVRHGSDRTSSLDVYCDVGSDWGIDTIEIEVVGDDGVARYNGPDEWIALHQDGGCQRIEFQDADTLETDVDAWIDACRGSGEPTLGGDEALHVAAVGCAWEDALDAGGWTRVERDSNSLF